MKTKQTPGRVSASYFGKYATAVPRKDSFDVYTTSNLLLILSSWLFAGAFFGLSLLFRVFEVSVVMTLVGATVGFLLATRVYLGRLFKQIPYEKISCFLLAPPDFTLALTDNQLFILRMMPKKQAKLMLAVAEAVKDNESYYLQSAGDRYRVVAYKKEQSAAPAPSRKKS